MGFVYLSDLSPRDGKWDSYKAQSLGVADMYHGTISDDYANRMNTCSGRLDFVAVPAGDADEQMFKLQAARFCRVRHCPICQWRRQLMWRVRFLRVMPRILAEHPGKRFIYLTLTVRNCELTELRSTLAWMSKSWERLSKRAQFPAIGWVKSVEVTRSTKGTAHPHLHALLMVNPGYFSNDYLSQPKWIELWRSSLRVDYDPSVRVNIVRQSKTKDSYAHSESGDAHTCVDEGLARAIFYTLKYSTKPEQLLGEESGYAHSQAWLLELTKQLHKTRAIAVGGLFKSYLSESDPEDLVHAETSDDVDTANQDPHVLFTWQGLKYALEV